MDTLRDAIFSRYDRAFECLECQAIFADACPERCDGCGNIVFLRHEKNPASGGYDPSDAPVARQDSDFGLKDFLLKKRTKQAPPADEDDATPGVFGYPFDLGGADSLFGGTD